MVRAVACTLVVLAVAGTDALAQGNANLSLERKAYAEWLTSAPTSPMAAVAMHRLGGTVSIGPDTADIPLAGFGPAVVSENRGA
ncbi:MAG TPA: hypothetical protein VFV65_02900, partial [Gemmatimonadales bacterium]|nr:hypothetical protein [Gemmatimonadales bacterium]